MVATVTYAQVYNIYCSLMLSPVKESSYISLLVKKGMMEKDNFDTVYVYCLI